jgi:hypothetical protein
MGVKETGYKVSDWINLAQVEGSYEFGTEPSASINGRNFLTQLSNY